MHCDLLIVGGGIVGTSIAYFACKTRPDWRVLLVDQSRVGGGASELSAGFDAVESPSADRRDLAIRSRLLYRAMARDVPDARVSPVVTHWIIGKHDAPTFAANFMTKIADFSQLEFVDVIENASFFVRTDKCVLRDRHNGYARPAAISRGIVNCLRARAAHFSCWEGVEAVAMQSENGACVVHLGDGRTILAKRVALAVGAWLLQSNLAGTVPASLRLRTKKVGSMCVDVRPVPTDSAIVFYDEDAFLLPLRDEGRWIFSFTLNAWDASPQRSGCTLDPVELHDGLHMLHSLAPMFVSSVGGTRVSYDVYTPDCVPIVYSPSAMPQVTIASGCSGAGYRVAPALAEDLVARIHLQ